MRRTDNFIKSALGKISTGMAVYGLSSRLKMNSLRSALTTVLDGQNVPAIRAYGSGTTNLTTANQHASRSNCPFPWCYGTEFASKAMELWAYHNSVHLDFIRPRRPVEDGYIESFTGRLRDECLNVEGFFTLLDARRKPASRQQDYNHHRPHSALADRTPAEFAALCSGGNDGDKIALENAARFPHFHRTTTTGSVNRTETYSGLLLATVT